MLGACSVANRNVRVSAHELGHNHGLEHGGRPYIIAMNSKPQYQSMMNYSYEYDSTNAPAFSHGTASLSNLNPMQMDERLGLNTLNSNTLSAMQEYWEWG